MSRLNNDELEITKCGWCQKGFIFDEMIYEPHYEITHCEGCTDDIAQEKSDDLDYGTYMAQVEGAYYASR